MDTNIPKTTDDVYSVPDTETLCASQHTPCPLCQKTEWCFLIKDTTDIFKVICGRTNDAPTGWTLTGIAKDNRNIFTRVGRERRRYHLPQTVRLSLIEKPDLPQWTPVCRSLDTLKPGDLVRFKIGNRYSQLKKILLKSTGLSFHIISICTTFIFLNTSKNPVKRTFHGILFQHKYGSGEI